MDDDGFVWLEHVITAGLRNKQDKSGLAFLIVLSKLDRRNPVLLRDDQKGLRTAFKSDRFGKTLLEYALLL
jgi:hypothetical protein